MKQLVKATTIVTNDTVNKVEQELKDLKEKAEKDNKSYIVKGKFKYEIRRNSAYAEVTIETETTKELLDVGVFIGRIVQEIYDNK